MTILKRASLAEIYAPIEQDLNEFRSLFEQELASKDTLIRQIHDHLLKMSGKFLRPALTLFGFYLDPTQPNERLRVMRLAVAIELIHNATLVHDDIIDNSELRRNQPSIFSKWGKEISIVAGDYLYAKAFVLLAGLKDPWVSEAFASCAHVICEGEMKQIEKRTDFRMTEEEYLKIIYQKTAALFEASCGGGAYLGGATKELIAASGRYGRALGMAFQIVDDCLDLVGDPESLGKTIGLDLYKNDVSLPLLYLMQGLGDQEARSLADQMRLEGMNLFPKIKQMALESKAIERAMEKARSFASQAQDALRGVRFSTADRFTSPPPQR